MSKSTTIVESSNIPNLITDNNRDKIFEFGNSYERDRAYKADEIWRQLREVTVLEALNIWLAGLAASTRDNYASGFKVLFKMRLVDGNSDLQKFSLINHESVIDEIKQLGHWKEATKQTRAAAYISFTGFLQRRTQGIIRKAMPSKEGVNRTFFKIREKVKTNFLTKQQTKRFLRELEKINSRDALIAKLILQGGKRQAEVLNLEIKRIDFEKSRISFVQSKTRGTKKITIITYHEDVMKELRGYIGRRRVGLVFITRKKNKVISVQIHRTFLKAGKIAGIPFRMTPHVLRVTLVTRLKELNVQDSDIMKITGHANPASLAAYDKTDPAENASLYHSFT